MSSKRFKAVVMMLAVLALGSILLAACVRPGTTTTTSTGGGSTATSTPSGGGGGGGCASGTVHMDANNFVQSCVNISKGSKLTLIDDVQVPHIISNGMWDSSGNVKQVTEPGAPTVNNVTIAGGSADIGPFNTAGTFHIYCSVHQGMNLVVNVK
jgi:plastocyanin